ncbi:sensor histidine kinase [Asticcacaulis taihuensis]|uniref:histidine kinase n=1 Tax=Asticcacaulis taihuensis TaxID=260084 RepID=A0A1G4RJC1_9CAUL|nr:response regulator [Asticcacaulis taihuensis]SCW57063.1 His Kinase A (phospho-acceptor) domain-containing protein [Asticcacaulis taihuensis]
MSAMNSLRGDAQDGLGVAKPKILIVDDRWENLLATEALLKPLGADIATVDSGEKALDLVLKEDFAIVLLDVQMPVMDGFETARLMKTRPSMQNVPIIFVTAISKEDHFATEAAEIGAVDYIFKPINSDILKSKVKVYLDLYTQRQQILQLNAHLRQSNEELERFAYVCSHDMQEPVRMMNAYAGLLAEGVAGQLDETALGYAEYIRDNAVRVQTMIRDILNFSRIGREEVKLETVDCQKVFDGLMPDFADIVAEKQARVTAAGLPVIRTSPTLMRVLLQNLVGNALKFQDGSRMPEISVSARKEGKAERAFWRFDVADNGIGIDPVFHERIFQVFQRLHSFDDYIGTGIGLSTCRKFVRLCGGDISLRSKPGEGSVFSFTLPDKGV